jgi:hypothetical protein
VSVVSAPSATLKGASVVVRFTEPKDVKLVPSGENSIAMLDVPLKVRPAKLSCQLLPLCGSPVRSTSKTTVAALGAIMASDSVSGCPAFERKLKESKSVNPGASRFEVSEPPTAALGTSSSDPPPALTLVEPKLPSRYIVP